MRFFTLIIVSTCYTISFRLFLVIMNLRFWVPPVQKIIIFSVRTSKSRTLYSDWSQLYDIQWLISKWKCFPCYWHHLCHGPRNLDVKEESNFQWLSSSFFLVISIFAIKFVKLLIFLQKRINTRFKKWSCFKFLFSSILNKGSLRKSFIVDHTGMK